MRHRRLLVVLVSVLIAGCMNPTTPSPTRVYGTFFETPIASVQQLRGGGIAFQGHDVWLAFESRNPIVLRQQSIYRSLPAAEAKRLFLEGHPIGIALPADAALEAFLATEPNGYSNGKLLLVDRAAGHYYFRSWSHT